MKLPKFRYKSKGPLTEEEHNKCAERLGKLFTQMQTLTEGTQHHLSGRLQVYRQQPCPCIYVFYSKETFNDEQRGLMYIIQDLENREGVEIVFRKWNTEIPIPLKEWGELSNTKHDDRYKVCSANKWEWRAYQVRNEEELKQAQELLVFAKQKFEETYNIK